MVSGFSDLAGVLEQAGVLDFLLPFLLVFTIIFAALQKVNIFGSGPDKKKFNVIIALALGLSFVVPHILGTYPLGYDPVVVLNETLPSISLVAVAGIMLMVLLGIFGKGIGAAAAPWIALGSFGFVVYIFGSSLNLWNGPYDVWSWWSPEITELMVILFVFGLVVWFITKEPGGGEGVGAKLKKGVDYIGNLIDDRN